MTASTSGAQEALSARARRRILAILTLWFCMALIDVGVVNVALPSIQHGLGATSSDLQWILSGYTLTFGAVLIAAGRAGDILGRGGLFLAGLAVFTVSSLAAALAPAPAWLNVARFVEGIGAGGMSPQVYGMVQDFFHGEERGRAFGFLGMATSLAVAIAPTLGGVLIAVGGPSWGWRLAFLVNVPLGAVGFALAWRWFPKPLVARRRALEHGPGLWAALDPPGSLLAAFALLAVLYPFVEFRASTWAWASLPAGLAAAALWVAWERRLAARGRPAMVDLRLFARPSFSNGLAIQTLYFLGMTSIWVLVALYVQEAAGLSAFEAGLLSVLPALCSAALARWAGARVVRLGRRLVIAGQWIAVLGLALGAATVLAHAHAGFSIWWLAAALSVYGAGQGMTISPNQTLTLEAVPAPQAGSAGALVSVSQRVGASVGIAAVTAVVFALLPRSSWSTATVAGFALMALLVLAAIAVGVRDLHAGRARHR